jgi:O-antigen/teichoic acid export membrane protein
MLNTLLTAIFPMLSRLAIHDSKKFVFRIKSLLNITIMLGIWASFSFALFSHNVVEFLYGNVYKTTAEIIVIQCWYTLLFAIFCIIGTVLSALDKHRLLSFLSMIYTIISLPLFYLGSKDGAIGLSIAFVISAFINMTYHWIIFRKALDNEITIIYSASLFFIIGLLIYLSYNFNFNISIIIKFIIEIFITLFFIIIFYKTEYKKLSIILKNQ